MADDELEAGPRAGPARLAVELRRVRLPLRRPFRAAHGSVADRELLLVRVATEAAEGWGECAAFAEPGWGPEDLASAHAALARKLVPALRAAGGPPRAARVAGLPGAAAHPMAAAALEAALLDAELRAAGVALAAHLGGRRATVEAGVALGIAGSVGELVDQVDRARAEGYRRVKLKIRPGWDLVPVAAVRERFGDAVVLQVDANGSYGPGDADHLAGLDVFGLAMIEQPLPPPSLAGHAELSRRIRTPVCLDESITSAAAAAAAIEAGAAAVVTVKPARLGGLAEARRVHDVCLAAGIDAWCGGMLESTLGRAALVGLASLPGFTRPGDLAPPERYLAADLAPPLARRGPMLEVPTTPGLGANPTPGAVDAVTVSVEPA